MHESLHIHFPLLNRDAIVRKSSFSHVVLREGQYSVSVDRIPLTEYFVFFDSPVKAEQIKLKLYKDQVGKWFDKAYSEEAELHSPEFGIPQLIAGVKPVIDAYEAQHQGSRRYSH